MTQVTAEKFNEAFKSVWNKFDGAQSVADYEAKATSAGLPADIRREFQQSQFEALQSARNMALEYKKALKQNNQDPKLAFDALKGKFTEADIEKFVNSTSAISRFALDGSGATGHSGSQGQAGSPGQPSPQGQAGAPGSTPSGTQPQSSTGVAELMAGYRTRIDTAMRQHDNSFVDDQLKQTRDALLGTILKRIEGLDKISNDPKKLKKEREIIEAYAKAVEQLGDAQEANLELAQEMIEDEQKAVLANLRILKTAARANLQITRDNLEADKRERTHESDVDATNSRNEMRDARYDAQAADARTDELVTLRTRNNELELRVGELERKLSAEEEKTAKNELDRAKIEEETQYVPEMVASEAYKDIQGNRRAGFRSQLGSAKDLQSAIEAARRLRYGRAPVNPAGRRDSEPLQFLGEHVRRADYDNQVVQARADVRANIGEANDMINAAMPRRRVGVVNEQGQFVPDTAGAGNGPGRGNGNQGNNGGGAA